MSIIDTTALLLYYPYIRIAEQQLGQLTEINDDWLKTGAVETLINDDINTLLNIHMISYAGGRALFFSDQNMFSCSLFSK